MEKGTGVLLPVSALPSKYGIGTLGAPAFDFIAALGRAKQKYWQILPLSPTGYGDSPYQSCSAFAFSPYYIDPETLFAKGLITSGELASCESYAERVDYGYLFNTRINLLKKAFSRFDVSVPAFKTFKKQNPELCGFALYMTVKEQNGYKPWYEWSKDLRIPSAKTLEALQKENSRDIDFWLFTQYEFILEYKNLLTRAKKSGVKIIADIPIYVALDSADVWLNPELFQLDSNRCPKSVAGVPPDYFSETGQLWGNPLYDYKRMEADNFSWWHRRIKYCLQFCSALRIDHFRGFDRFYAIKAGALTAKDGHWKKGPGEKLFKDILSLPVIAEDLGLLDGGVMRLLKKTRFPGMKVLSFAFDSNAENAYKPSNFADANCIAYTGTHDNEPFLCLARREINSGSRFINDLNGELIKAGLPQLLKNADEYDATRAVLELLYASKADVKIAPVQDILMLGSGARINFPSTLSTDNWSFRLDKGQIEEIEKYFTDKSTK